MKKSILYGIFLSNIFVSVIVWGNTEILMGSEIITFND